MKVKFGFLGPALVVDPPDSMQVDPVCDRIRANESRLFVIAFGKGKPFVSPKYLLRLPFSFTFAFFSWDLDSAKKRWKGAREITISVAIASPNRNPATLPNHHVFRASSRMLSLRYPPAIVTQSLELNVSRSLNGNGFVVCSLKGPRPRYPRVWKSRKRIGTISKSAKLIECIKGLSNVKEEVYGALDSFIAWELEFPLITVKKALKTLEREKEWKRLIQVTKWMLSKGQGKTKGSYYTLLNALAEDGRLEEAEELWAMIFSENLENLPREFFSKMISIYYNKGMHEKMFEVFADMEELGVRPNSSIIEMLGNVFQELGMLDKYEKLMKKYPPTIWEYRYFKGKRVRTRSKVGPVYNAKVSLSEHRNGVYVEDNAKISQLEHSNGVDEEVNAEVSQLKPPHGVDLEASAQVPNLEHQNGVGEEPNARLPQWNHQNEVDEDTDASLPQLMHQNTVNVEADSSLLS